MKKFILSLAILFFSFNIFCQEAQDAQNAQQEAISSESTHSFFITLGPQITNNSYSGPKGAPSPIYYTIGFGGNFFEDKKVSFQSRLSFSTNYYLWDGKDARPAEVENRTASIINAMLDLNGLYTFGTKHIFQVGGGLGFFIRYALLADGIEADDAGGTETSTAQDDVSSINSWFYSDFHFIYPQIVLSYTYNVGKWKVGAQTNLYFPLASIIKDQSMDSFMASLCVKLLFPK